MSPATHARHHVRFYVALIVGVVAYAVCRGLDPALAPLLAGDAFFASYLGLMARFIAGSSIHRLRQRADVADEGASIITLLTVAAICFCLGSLFSLIGGKASLFHLLVSLASVPLGWLMLHSVIAFHYAHLYYAPVTGPDGRREDRGGLAFPGREPPGVWDFLYFSFVIGVAAQVSDVAIEDSGIRRLALAHGVVSFFFNTVLLALAVNLALNAGP